jgi:uncharacterized Tic20 family protein
MPDRYCRECGTEASPGSRFCSSCGNELNAQSGDATQSATGAQTPYDNTGTQTHGNTTGEQSGPEFDDYYKGSSGTTQTTKQRTESQSTEYGHWDQSAQTGTGQQYNQYQPSKDTDIAAIAHLAGLFAGIIGTILIYAIADDPFAKENAANAADWQIMVLIYSFATFFLIFVHPVFILGFFGIMIANFGFPIVGAIKASNGKTWEYPLTPNILSSSSSRTPPTNDQNW